MEGGQLVAHYKERALAILVGEHSSLGLLSEAALAKHMDLWTTQDSMRLKMVVEARRKVEMPCEQAALAPFAVAAAEVLLSVRLREAQMKGLDQQVEVD
jgi:hypothetical protein